MTENEDLGDRLRDAVPEPPTTTDWGLQARGRAKRDRQRRLAAAGTALAVGAVVIVVAAVGAVGSGGDSEQDPVTTPSTTVSSKPEETGSLLPRFPEEGSVKTDAGEVVGTWEDGTLLGDVFVLDTSGEHPEVLFAAERTYAVGRKGRTKTDIYLGYGLRVDGRLFRLLTWSVPDSDSAPDGMELYGGQRLDDGTWQVLGVVPGSVEIDLEGEQGEAILSSHDVLADHTVFEITGSWQDGWSETELAPLTITTSDGTSVEVRERSWVG